MVKILVIIDKINCLLILYLKMFINYILICYKFLCFIVRNMCVFYIVN